MKTHSGAKKRFRKTASGLFKKSSAFRRHHAWSRTAKQTMSLRGVHYVSQADSACLKVLLPN
jgi:large subunit ribosomal protein L35